MMKSDFLSLMLDIGTGDFHQGFAFRMRLLQSDRLLHSWSGKLPASPQLRLAYQRWKQLYESLGQNTLISVESAQVTNISVIDECQAAAKALKTELNRWLNHPNFRLVERQLLHRLPYKTPLHVFIQTQDPCLQRLPWQVWSLLEECYPKAEVILSASYESDLSQLRLPVRILAIEGDVSGTQAQLDLGPVSAIAGTEVKLLHQPSANELRQYLWDEVWDMFCFMGHSRSQAQTGDIALNSTETISLTELREAMRHAADRGLKLAIFNSCDGVGIAQNLADLKIPYTIVMREPIPDQVAKRFFATFLTSFARGEPIQAAVNIARRQLQEAEQQFPFGGWLPVIYQNPAARPMKYPRPFPWKWVRRLLTGVMSMLAVIVLTLWLNHSMPINPPPPELSEKNFTLGEKLLVDLEQIISSKLSPEAVQKVIRLRDQASKAFNQQDYASAQKLYDQAREVYPNDPEALIYRNNAIALQCPQSAQMWFAVAVPGEENTDIDPSVTEELLRGVGQAQDEFNQDEQAFPADQQKCLVMQVVQDNANAEQAAAIARAIAQKDEILGMIGHFSSDVSLNAAEVYQAENLPMISPTSSAVQLTQKGDYILRTMTSDQLAAQSLANYLVNGLKKRRPVIFFNQASAYSLSLKSAFTSAVEKLGGKIVDDYDLSNRRQSVRDNLMLARESSADSIVILSNYEDRTSQVSANNVSDLPILGGDGLYNDETLTHSPNIVLAIPQYDGDNDSGFAKSSQTLWKQTVNWRSMSAYDATQAFLTAAKKQPSRTDIQAALGNPAFRAKGAVSEIKFHPTGDRDAPVALVKAVTNDQGKRVFQPVKSP